MVSRIFRSTVRRRVGIIQTVMPAETPRILSIVREPVLARTTALECVAAGGIVLFPTETVYGLGVDSRQPAAMERLYDLKQRPKEKPFQWLIADADLARRQSPTWDDAAERLARAFWPGPLTLVVNGIGWRVPRHDWLLGWLRELGRPLVATSANLAGAPPARSCAAALEALDSGVSLALDGGEIPEDEVSTVARIEQGRLHILREGALKEGALRRILA